MKTSCSGADIKASPARWVLRGGMTVIAVILVVVAILAALTIKDNNRKASEYPDGDPAHAVDSAEVSRLMRG